MSEKVKKKISSILLDAGYSMLGWKLIFWLLALMPWLAIGFFCITLLRPAPVRPELSLDGCGSHNISPKSPDRAGRWPGASNHRPADFLATEDTEKYSHESTRIDTNSKKAEDLFNTKCFIGKAGGAVGHGTRNRPPTILAAEDWLDKLITKIHVVESGGRLNSPDGDDGRAVGALQLHKCAVDDVNFYYGQNFPYILRHDLEAAELIAKLYISMWMDIHREEIAARIFNGGPRGWKKESTDGYWVKIKNVATDTTLRSRASLRSTRGTENAEEN